jgi:hypothetical protein
MLSRMHVYVCNAHLSLTIMWIPFLFPFRDEENEAQAS